MSGNKVILAGAVLAGVLVYYLRKIGQQLGAMQTVTTATAAATVGAGPAIAAAPAFDLSGLVRAITGPTSDDYERAYFDGITARVDIPARAGKRICVYRLFVHSDGTENQRVSFWHGTQRFHAVANASAGHVLSEGKAGAWYRTDAGESFGIFPEGGKELNAAILYRYED